MTTRKDVEEAIVQAQYEVQSIVTILNLYPKGEIHEWCKGKLKIKNVTVEALQEKLEQMEKSDEE